MVTEERKKKIDEFERWKHPFSVAVYNISKEFNIGSLLRTAHCAKAENFYLIGERSYNTYAAVSSQKWTKINYFETIEEFIEHIKETDFNLVLVDQAEKSQTLFDFEFPEKPLFFLGTEKGGLPEKIINGGYPIIEIPQYGLVQSLNLSCSGSIVIYHYLYKLYKENNIPTQIKK